MVILLQFWLTNWFGYYPPYNLWFYVALHNVFWQLIMFCPEARICLVQMSILIMQLATNLNIHYVSVHCNVANALVSFIRLSSWNSIEQSRKDIWMR